VRKRRNIAQRCAVLLVRISHPIDRVGREPGELKMKVTSILPILVGVTAVLVSVPRSSEATVSAAQLYPYCQISSSNGGGMNCYLSSRAQCEFREVCVSNPSYLGAQRAHAWKRDNKPPWRWWR
jgi:hypothetical protein